MFYYYLPSETFVSLTIHDALRDKVGDWLESWLNGREMEHAGRFIPFFSDGKCQEVLFPI